MVTKTSRLTIDLPKEEHKRLKMAASLLGTTMKDLVLMSVEEWENTFKDGSNES